MRITKKLEQQIIHDGIVDTDIYRYRYVEHPDRAEIQRLPRNALDTTDALDGWITVKEYRRLDGAATISDILTAFNLTQTQLAEQTGIPLRTVQNWAEGKRQPPDYLPKMIDAYLRSR